MIPGVELPSSCLVAVMRDGVDQARILVNPAITTKQALHLLAGMLETLRMQVVIEQLQADRRVQLFPADAIPGVRES